MAKRTNYDTTIQSMAEAAEARPWEREQSDLWRFLGSLFSGEELSSIAKVSRPTIVRYCNNGVGANRASSVAADRSRQLGALIGFLHKEVGVNPLEFANYSRSYEIDDDRLVRSIDLTDADLSYVTQKSIQHFIHENLETE